MYLNIRVDKLGRIAKGIRGWAASPAARLELAEELTLRAERIMEVSSKLVPVSDHGSHGRPAGFLKNSDYIDPPTFKGTGTTQVDMGYSAPYAKYVHEHTHVEHKRGTAKFLEKAVNAEARGTLDALEVRVDKMLRKAFYEAMVGGK